MLSAAVVYLAAYWALHIFVFGGGGAGYPCEQNTSKKNRTDWNRTYVDFFIFPGPVSFFIYYLSGFLVSPIFTQQQQQTVIMVC